MSETNEINESRREFIIKTGAVVISAISFSALNGLALPVLADYSGINRLNHALQEKQKNGTIGVLNWNCFTANLYAEPCYPGTGYSCTDAIYCGGGETFSCISNISCAGIFTCSSGSDPSYGCTTRYFQCTAEFTCSGIFNCKETAGKFLCEDNAYSCTGTVHENYE